MKWIGAHFYLEQLRFESGGDQILDRAFALINKSMQISNGKTSVQSMVMKQIL